MKKIYLILFTSIFSVSNSLSMQRLNTYRKMYFLVLQAMAKKPAPTPCIAAQDQILKELLEAQQARPLLEIFNFFSVSHTFKKEDDALTGNTLVRILNISQHELTRMSATQLIAKLNEAEKDTPETLAMEHDLKRLIKQRADYIQSPEVAAHTTA